MTEGYEMVTVSGYPFDEAVSALQKSIRRGLEEESMYWALEINGRYPEYLWKRLVVIACEDIGGANPQLIQTVCSLASMVERMRKESKNKDYDPVILGYAILSMARSPKSREADDYVNQVMRKRRLGEMKLEIPDWAKDKHTKSGRAMGRGSEYFWSEGAKLENETYPSQYQGWDPEKGDGARSPKGFDPKAPSDQGRLFDGLI